MSLGILGGTFNPIHCAHLRLAEEMREALGLSRVLFVPAAHPPLKPQGVAPVEHRLEMARLATATNPSFEVLDLELERDGPSYTVDTLYELRARHPGEPLWFIVGSDALRELDRWHQPQALFELANLAVVEREPSAGGLLALLPESLRAPFQKGPAGLIHSSGHELRPVPFTRLEISASDVRRRIARGASVRYLIPDPVLDYIEKQRLYA